MTGKRHGHTRVVVNPLAVECPWCFAKPGEQCANERGEWLAIGSTRIGEIVWRRVHGMRADAAHRSAIEHRPGDGRGRNE